MLSGCIPVSPSGTHTISANSATLVYNVTFTPINRCATNNAGCGSASAYLCTYLGDDAYNCSAINNCLTNNGGCAHNCQYTGAGTNTCSCNTGYSLGSDSKSCPPINNCVTSNGGCGTNSVCSFTGPATSTCKCSTNYYSPSNSQKDCTPINACATNNGACGSNSICTYTGANTRSCTCQSGFWSLSGANCNIYSVCSAGTYETTSPTATNDRVCTACPAGYLCSGAIQPQACGSSSSYSSGGASSCTQVTAGYYTTPTNASATTRTGQSICPAGSSCNSGNATVCAAGKYQALPGQTSCQSCSSCATGLNMTVSCNLTADIVCKGLHFLFI